MGTSMKRQWVISATTWLLSALVAALACASEFGNTASVRALNQGPSVDTIALLGVWHSGCLATDARGPVYAAYTRETYTFGASGSYIFETNQYEDSSCAEAAVGGNTYYGTYKLGTLVKGDNGEVLRRIDLNLDSPDWPEQMAPTQVQWVYSIEKSRLYFGVLSLPTSRVYKEHGFDKALPSGQGPLVF
jgi:hypothetical protein